jgi:acyl carrier protein
MDELAKLRLDLKKLLVKRLRLEGVAPESIDDDAPFVGAPLQLDSIDLLELALAVEEAYGIKIDDDELGKAAFRSIGSLAEFLREEIRARASGGDASA